MNKPLVITSVAAHIAAGVGIFVWGIWGIERLDRARSDLGSLAVLMPPQPAPGGDAVGGSTPKLDPRPQPKIVVKHLTQLLPPPKVVATTPSGGDDGPPGGKPGAGGPGDPDATGTCVVPPCGEGPPLPPVQLPPAPTAPAETIIPSSALDLLRISGETQVHPTSATHHEMVADRIAMAVGTIRLCVSVHGEVTSAQLLRSTKYPDYDARLLAAVRAWRYKPYLNHGQAVRVCSAVTFQYKPRQ